MPHHVVWAPLYTWKNILFQLQKMSLLLQKQLNFHPLMDVVNIG
jgi:hypothetical protein